MLVPVDWPSIAGAVPTGSLLRIRPEVAARIWADPHDARFAAQYGIPFHADLSSFSHMLHLLESERPLPESDPLTRDWIAAEERIRAKISCTERWTEQRMDLDR